uniref:SFRICE_003343 n=1 Tax=Spodoptera frugiperda TaxID=7108 RepID=A0A2H1VGC6_SPOFR
MGVLCQILLDRPEDGVFKAGGLVTGTLKYFIDKPTQYRSITMCFLGKGQCEWTETDSNKNTVYYRNEENYFNQTVNVLGNRDDFILGGFEYPFQFVLPIDIPPSFNNDTCTIEYKITVTFVKANSTLKKDFDVEIPVSSYVNPCSLEPMIFALKKNLSFRIKNKIHVKGEIIKTCVSPGDNIQMILTVNNGSDVEVFIKTELIKRLTYVSSCNNKEFHEESVKNTSTITAVAANGVANLVCVVPTYHNLCSIQHTKVMIGEYKIRLTAKVPFPHINAVLDIPVAIGPRKHELIPPAAMYYQYHREQPSCSAMSAHNIDDQREEASSKHEKQNLNDDGEEIVTFNNERVGDKQIDCIETNEDNDFDKYHNHNNELQAR